MTLEEKILKAKSLGARFYLIDPGYGATGEYKYDQIPVYQNITNDEFEKQLDEHLNKLEDTSYLGILKKHDLI